MGVLVLKVLGPLLALAQIVRSERGKRSDVGAWKLVRRTAWSIGGALLAVVLLVYDHVDQSAAVAEAKEQAADAREARKRIEESTSEQAAALTAAKGEAAEARRALQRIEDATAEVVALMRERDPGLTEQEALDRLAEELRQLQKRSGSLENQLNGLRTYSDVARLNALGKPGTFGPGSGLRYSSALTRALEGSWGERDGRFYRRCDQVSLAKFTAVTESHPTFPFAHYALADCAYEVSDESWRLHADRALKILRHTTQMAGHHPHHDEVYELLRSRLEQQP